MDAKKNFVLCAGWLFVLALLAGCKPEPLVASPACVEMNKTTDPIKKKELEKQCPRASRFKPSPHVTW
ncbi:entry exclusion lipoprotein TrbK [Oxalobacteraceae bacterium A2-2]